MKVGKVSGAILDLVGAAPEEMKSVTRDREMGNLQDLLGVIFITSVLESFTHYHIVVAL